MLTHFGICLVLETRGETPQKVNENKAEKKKARLTDIAKYHQDKLSFCNQQQRRT